MTNIVKCDRCSKTLIIEEYEKHICTPILKSIQDIVVDYYYEGKKDELGHDTFFMKGLNGVFYRVVKCLHNPPHTINRPTKFDSDSDPTKTRQNPFDGSGKSLSVFPPVKFRRVGSTSFDIES